MRAHAPGSWRAETCRARQGVCVVERGQTTARVDRRARRGIYVPRPKDPPATCTSRDGDLGACNLDLPARARLRVSCTVTAIAARGYRITRNRPPRAAATRRSDRPIRGYTRPAAGTTFTGKVFKSFDTRPREAPSADTGRSPRRQGQRTPHAVHQRVARSVRRRVGASRDGGYFWTALEHA